MVTGANSGIGWHTALELARAGGEVILAARTEAKGRDAVERIRRELSQAKVRAEVLDLASLRSVRAFTAKVSCEAKLDLLVNNAGVMSVPKRELTEDGFELQFGTNFLGPFALTGLLMPVLQRSASPRVTTVSSGAANMGTKKINFDDLQWERSYGPWKAYCQSKLADLLFTLELGKRCAAARIGLLSNAAHPGCAYKSADERAGQTTESIGALLVFLDREDYGFVHVAGCGSRSAADAACGDGDRCGSGKLLCAGSNVWTEGRSGPCAGSEAGAGSGGRATAVGGFAEVDGSELRGALESRGQGNAFCQA